MPIETRLDQRATGGNPENAQHPEHPLLAVLTRDPLSRATISTATKVLSAVITQNPHPGIRRGIESRRLGNQRTARIRVPTTRRVTRGFTITLPLTGLRSQVRNGGIATGRIEKPHGGKRPAPPNRRKAGRQHPDRVERVATTLQNEHVQHRKQARKTGASGRTGARRRATGESPRNRTGKSLEISVEATAGRTNAHATGRTRECPDATPTDPGNPERIREAPCSPTRLLHESRTRPR